MLKRAIFRSFVELSNHRFQSYLLKSFASSKISKPLIPLFVKTFRLNEEEMVHPLPNYLSLHELFIRHLKPECRPVNTNKKAFVSPVDGILAEFGSIKDGIQFQVKGQQYTVSEILGSTERAKTYHGGLFIVLYLSPSHYHRIHSPVTGQILKQWTLGGRSYPVNEWGMLFGKQPLSRNYRVITELEHSGKNVAIVKVGAMNINTIELTHQNERLKKGEEVGYFSFGSTVVLLLEKDFVDMNNEIIPREVKMGEQIATLLE